jgi:hypothetical protein
VDDLPTPPATPPSQSEGMAPAGPIAPQPPAPRQRTGLIVAIVLVVLALIVGGVVVGVTRDGDGAAATDTPSPASTQAPTRPATPTAFDAEGEALRVSLTWTADTSGTEAVSYAISRNGKHLLAVSAPKTNAFDTTVAPGTTYHYSVVAVDADGKRSRPAKLTVTTAKLPLSEAPLSGVFNVALNVTSHYGYSSFNSFHDTAGWRFRPVCPKGACDTDLTDTGQKAFTTTLNLKAPTYSGSLSFRGFAICNGTVSTANVTITLHVTKADVEKETWRATKVEGTMIVRVSPQLGCVASGIDYAIRGSWVA